MKKSEMRIIVTNKMESKKINQVFEIEDIYQAAHYSCSEITFEFVADTFNKVLVVQNLSGKYFDNTLEEVRRNGATAYKFVK